MGDIKHKQRWFARVIQLGLRKSSTRINKKLNIGVGVAVSAFASLLLVFSVSVFALPPSTPSALNATAGYNEVGLTWTAPDDDGGSAISDYIIEYSLGGADSWNIFDDGVSTETSTTVTSLSADTTYDFRVSAVNEDTDVSDPSESASATVLNPAPGAPTDLQATAGVGEVSLSWVAPAWEGSSEVIDYIIEYSLSGQNDWTDFSDGLSTATSAVVIGLTSGTAYDFRVIAVNDTETSQPSTTQSATPYSVPDAPTGVSAVRGNGEAVVSFTAPVDDGGVAITGYTVTSNPGNITASGAGSPITVTGLANGTAYTFTVVATNSAGDSEASEASNSVTPATVPGAPTVDSVTAGNGQVVVEFTAPTSDGGSAITGYTVTSNPGNITASGSSSPITVTGLANGTSYSFTVTATNGVGEGSASAASSSVIPHTVPGVPTDVSATRGNGQATVSFSAPASNGGSSITGYTVTSNPGGITASGANSPITVTGLANGTAYTFTVVATNAAGDGGVSEASNSVVPATTPGVPSGLSATGGAKEAELSWGAPSANGESITGYVVEYSIAGANDWQTFSDGSLDAVSATVTGLVDGTEYDFRVAAVNAVGQGGFATSSATTFDVPGAPTGVSAAAGNSQATVSFSAPASNGGSAITGYTVTSNPGNITASGSSSPITVTGLTNGIAYTFTVVATNAIGTSDASSASSSVTPRTTPGAPTNLTANPGNSQVGLTWNAPVSNGGSTITDYVIEYKLSADSTWTTFSDGESADLNATVTGLTNGTAYDFRVLAVNEAGTGGYSSMSSSTPRTTPGAPTSVSATRGNGQATVSFTTPGSNGGSAITSYTVTSNPGNITASGASSPITVPGLANGTAYTFTVVATNAAGDSEASEASNSVTPATAPGAPTSVSATAGNGQAEVTFTAPASDGGSAITTYTVTSTPGNITASGSSSPITVSGLENGTSYSFTVTATNDVGEGAASAASGDVTPHTIPGAPTNIVAEAGNTEATVSFNAPASNGGAAITNYKVISNPDGIEANGSSSPITVTGLTNGTAYTFTVIATNSAGNSEVSVASNSVTPAAVPDAPAGLVATPGNTQVALSWTTPNDNGSDITDYIVQYKQSANSTWITFTDGVSTTTTATITGLMNGTQYDFRVAASSEVGNGSYSSTVSSTPRTLPGEPAGLALTPGNQQVSLTWNAPASNGGAAITDYIIEYSLSGEGDWSVFSDDTSPATNAVVTGLDNGVAYDFRVAAVNDAGTGGFSSSASSTPRTTPGAPTDVTATRGNGQATVSFQAPSSNGGSAITSYTVVSNPGGVEVSGSSSPITVTGLDNGTSYTFTVIATNVAGDSDPSATSNSVVPATTPGAPTSVLPSAGVSQVELAWTAPASSGGLAITDYVVEYKISTDSTWTTFADGASTSTSATVTGLANGTQYDFRIAAVNEVGLGSYSTTISSTPRTVPGAPTGLQATPNNERVALSWTAPASNGGASITDYIVEYSLSGENDWTTFADGASTSTSATVTGLTNETAYDFRVTAVNVAGAGSASGVVTATPDLSYTTITNVQSSSTANSVTITWTTDISSNSQVQYGPDTSYGNLTVVSQTEGVTNHSVTITGLESCVTYSFRVISQPVADGGPTTSDNYTVSTSGCVGGETVVEEEIASVPVDEGGIVTLVDGDRTFTVGLPADYTTTDTVVQVKKLSGAPTDVTDVPSAGLVAIAGQVYEIKAILQDGTLVTEFDQPITITVQYTDEDVEGLDESTLAVYNWHDGEWAALADCEVDEELNTITCTTSQFSLFVLFGEAIQVEDEDDEEGASDDKTDSGKEGDDKTPSQPSAPAGGSGDGDKQAEDEDADNEESGQQTEEGDEKQSSGDQDEDEKAEENGLLMWLWIAGIGAVVAIIVALTVKRQRRSA